MSTPSTKYRPKPMPLDTAKMKERRDKLNLSMEDAAHAAGFTNGGNWFKIESGRNADIRISTLERVAVALKCKPRDLLK